MKTLAAALFVGMLAVPQPAAAGLKRTLAQLEAAFGQVVVRSNSVREYDEPVPSSLNYQIMRCYTLQEQPNEEEWATLQADAGTNATNIAALLLGEVQPYKVAIAGLRKFIPKLGGAPRKRATLKRAVRRYDQAAAGYGEAFTKFSGAAAGVSGRDCDGASATFTDALAKWGAAKAADDAATLLLVQMLHPT